MQEFIPNPEFRFQIPKSFFVDVPRLVKVDLKYFDEIKVMKYSLKKIMVNKLKYNEQT